MNHPLMSIWLLMSLGIVCASAQAGPSLLVLDFELIEEMRDPRTAAADQQRLQLITRELRERMRECPAFESATFSGAAANEIALARTRVAHLHRCNGCAPVIGEAANAELVLFPWVQKVSNLILNLNAEIRATASDQVLAARSVDIRGNTNKGWSRGVGALAERLCELDGKRFIRAPVN